MLPPTSSSLDLTISIPGFSGDRSVEGRAMRNLDINQVPAGEEEEEEDQEAVMMSMDIVKNDSSVELEDQDDDRNSNGDGGGAGSGSSPPRKKLRLSKEQSRLLEESFRTNHTLNPKRKETLATQLKLNPRQVEVWFQNRRARSKLKQTEMECEYLKRWFGSLSEQNRLLQRELEELRALKVAPLSVLSPHNGDPLPASALTMCPRCERVTATNPPPASSTTADGRAAAASGVTAPAAKLPAIRNMLPVTRQPSSAAC